jgi:hypothetical protein
LDVAAGVVFAPRAVGVEGEQVPGHGARVRRLKGWWDLEPRMYMRG